MLILSVFALSCHKSLADRSQANYRGIGGGFQGSETIHDAFEQESEVIVASKIEGTKILLSSLVNLIRSTKAIRIHVAVAVRRAIIECGPRDNVREKESYFQR